MSCIVCATRGGEGSRAVQLEAIERAKENGERLVFLYVTDTDTVGNIDEMLVTSVRQELNWMGNVLLRIAQKRAELAGLEADVAIREGNVGEAIGRFLQESQARLLLLGAPRGTTANVFGDDAIEQFASSIQEETGVKVEVVRPQEPEVWRKGTDRVYE